MKEQEDISVYLEEYVQGMISDEEIVNILSSYQYGEEGSTDGFDSLIVDEENSWTEVESAFHNGIITENIYTKIFENKILSIEENN